MDRNVCIQVILVSREDLEDDGPGPGCDRIHFENVGELLRPEVFHVLAKRPFDHSLSGQQTSLDNQLRLGGYQKHISKAD